MNILLLYNSTQTFTNTVFEHVDAFSRYSGNRYFFCHHDGVAPFNVDLSRYDAVGIHFCVRLPFDQISGALAERMAAFQGVKFLFIQDEYDHTKRAWHWIRRLGLNLVFTVVPPQNIEKIYPAAELPGVRFVSNLTGYVPEKLPSLDTIVPPSRREMVIGYRGRPLPIRYGALAQEKTGIGRLVRTFCAERGIPHDIAWDEESRIYGPRWYEFMASCRAMLGSESGSNVFDFDGTLWQQLAEYKAQNPEAGEQEIYDNVIAPHDRPGLMNQISPRVFEAISLRTVLVQFEGSYSGVIEPWKHYIPLRKDGGNLGAVFEALSDGRFIDDMAERAYRDVIGSGEYSYERWIRMVDAEMAAMAAALGPARSHFPGISASSDEPPSALTTHPARAAPPEPVVVREPEPVVEEVAVVAVEAEPEVADVPPPEVVVLPYPMPEPWTPPTARQLRMMKLKNAVVYTWQHLPPGVRPLLRPVARKGVMPAWRLVRRTVQKLRR